MKVENSKGRPSRCMVQLGWNVDFNDEDSGDNGDHLLMRVELGEFLRSQPSLCGENDICPSDPR